MGKGIGKTKNIPCLTQEQQMAYNSLTNAQRKYVDYRSMGYTKTQSYKMAGYSGKNAGQSAYLLERGNAAMAEIIEARLSSKKVSDITNDENSDINRQIDALAMQKSNEEVLAVIEDADGETAKRIQFYRDVVNGKIKTVRKTTKKNAQGATISTTIEEINDVETRMKARKELDRVLGLNAIVDIDKLNVGDITINIVDASKKDELEDSRNNVIIGEKVEEIDGEQVIVAEDKVEEVGTSKKEQFFENMGE